METSLADYLAHAPIFVRRFDGEITYWTVGAQELYGYPEKDAVGRNSHDLLKTVFPRPLGEIEAELLETHTWQGLLRHMRSDGSELWTESVWRLRGSGARLVVEMNTNVTSRELLARELNHRVKNTLAVVQGIARLSLRGCGREAMLAFENRISALAGAHDLLMARYWGRSDLRDVILRAIGAFGLADRVRLAGPHVSLQPSSVVAYSLAFHELATNALKHGALSTPDGSVEVAWRVHGSEGRNMHLVWREQGGPAVQKPVTLGFGARLIEKAVSSELGAPVELRFEPDGLVCEFNGATQATSSFPPSETG